MADKKTLKERRAESDSKIIESATICFAQKGYTNTSLSDIAKGAGVTSGLISQRYGTKENLFAVVFNKIMSEHFPDVDGDVSPRECLTIILNRIKKLSEENSDKFNFCLMLNHSTDIPESIFNDYKVQMVDKGNAFKILAKAQRDKMVPQGNLELLMLSFCANVFHHISLCKRFNTELPDDDSFLKIINYSDDEINKQKMKLKDQMIAIFCKEFQAVWLVKLEDLSMEILSSDLPEAIPHSIDTAIALNSYAAARSWYVNNCVVEQSKEKLLRESDINNVLAQLESGRTFHIEYGRIMNGSVNYNQLYYDKIINKATNKIEYILLGFRDVDATKKTEFDDLTGALLRLPFFREAEKMLNEYPEKQFDIVLSDIVDFKKINETYGSSVADSILRWHGNYLSSLSNENMIIGRYGGDQMVLFGLHDYIEECLSVPYRERFLKAESENGLPKINFKYGIYLDVKHGKSIISSCDKAHMALNSIKYHYSKEVAYYDDSIKKQMSKQRNIEDSMHESLKNGDFKVFYQPKHNPKTGNIVGAEALIRWIHPQYGFMAPNDFIPLFEQNGFVTEVDNFVGYKTCENLRKWMNKGIKVVPVSINVSKLTLARENLIDDIENAIHQYELSPGQLHMEITETLMTVYSEDIISKMNKLRELGCKIELDDFGSGYSSLNILSTFPIDILKLDMSFMQQFGDKKRTIVLESCIDMAKRLGFETVSEGVEIEEQKNILEKLGVDIIQGYYYSKPLSEDDFEQYLIKNSR